VNHPTVKIVDATLREGAQSPGVSYSTEQCERIARGLIAVGVDMIECGHPSASEKSKVAVRKLVGLSGRPPILSHARCHRADVDAVSDCGADWVGLFLGLNEVSRTAQLGRRTVTDLLEILEASVSHAKQRGLCVRYTLEDGSRTESELRKLAFNAAIRAGADRICLADTVGVLEPEQVKTAICELRHWFPTSPIEVHLHDDRGLATANALAAIDAGASWVACSVNGLGERCGITDLLQLLANLQFRGSRSITDAAALQCLSRLVGEISTSPVDGRRPVSGANAFHHSARLHKKAVLVETKAYNWIDPAILGRANIMDPD
jgi:2-isopropylmalate synthase